MRCSRASAWRPSRCCAASGVAVEFPGGQTCCGQPAYNAGFADAARTSARAFLRAFAGGGYVVSISGSCAAMVRDGFPRLFAGRPEEAAAADLAARTFEFSEFLVDVLGVEELPVARRATRDLPPLLPHAAPARRDRAAGAPAGHGRGPRVRAARASRAVLRLRRHLRGEDAAHLGGHGRREGRRTSSATGADLLVGLDMSCLMNIEGRLRRRGSRLEVRHLAEVLAAGWQA